VELPKLGTFYRTAFTLEAWVRPDADESWNDTGIVGTWDGASGGGPMLWHYDNRYRLTLSRGFDNYLTASTGIAAGSWQHIAATYDGTTARLYLDGVQIASRTFTGDVGNSDIWRIGAYGSSRTAPRAG
jgi:hypothetical protein